MTFPLHCGGLSIKLLEVGMNTFKRYEKDEKYVVDSFGLYEAHKNWEEKISNFKKHSATKSVKLYNRSSIKVKTN